MVWRKQGRGLVPVPALWGGAAWGSGFLERGCRAEAAFKEIK